MSENDDRPTSDDPNRVSSLLGLTGPVTTTLARVPRNADFCLPLIAVLTQGDEASGLSVRERQLLHLRAAAVGRPGPWLTYQATRAEAVLSADEVSAGQLGDVSLASFTKRETLAILWAGMVATNDAKREQKTFLELREHFDDSEVVEMTGAVGMSAFLDRFLRAAVETASGVGLSVDPAETAPVASEGLRQWAESVARSNSDHKAGS